MPNKEKPGWVTSYNMASLMNVPKAMERYGPLIDLWEGKILGEGFVCQSRSKIPDGMKKGWQKRLLERLLVSKSLDAITARYKGPNEDDINQSLDHSVYTQTSALAAFQARRPLSAVRVVGGKLGLVLKGGYILEFQLEVDEDGRGINSLYFFQWKLDANLIHPFSCNQITHSLLLLPCLMEPKRVGSYAAITSRWEELRADGTLGLPPHISSKEEVVAL